MWLRRLTPLLLVASSCSLTLRCAPLAPLRTTARCASRASRASVLVLSAAAGSANFTSDPDKPAGGLISPQDMAKLQARIARIAEDGLSTPAEKLFQLAMAKPPQVLMQDFFRSSPPAVTQAMQDAVVSLLGALPPAEFEAQVTTTGDKLAALMLQLQMTG